MKKLVIIIILILVSQLSFAQPPQVPADKGASFGDKVIVENAVSVEKLVYLMESKKDGEKKMEVVLKGVVTDVCTKEGCWIKVQSPDGKMMVRMKDHAFTVPLALNGKTVVINGTAEEKITSVEQLRHFAEDAGKSKEEIEAIKEPKKEIVIQAKGVLVV
ncbi:DUF4920 domain-containing protein [Foetidibacter luteolus]|uniref:DUF4920 domain-containing protein n=1 Tax=Foetidibacter luteolus TaxID=2608880 RepID=UPI00129A2142|nr:DUF4920 domain-containing protein [Foetidibacter luteolus]